MIFFSKEPAIELLHPTPAKVTIYLTPYYRIAVAVSMVTYAFYCLFVLYGGKSLTLAIVNEI